MGMGILSRLFGRHRRGEVRRRRFDAFQIEPTSRCNLRCRMCPRSRHAGEWRVGSLALEDYRRLSRDFGLTGHVHLQGWGEPLLHEDIAEMVAIAKQQGCTAGLTTNATLLDGELAGELIRAGLDVAGVSIAGATEETHARIRVGSSLEEVLRGVECLMEARAKLGSGKPRVVLSFMLTTLSIAELPAAVEVAGRLGVDELVATNLDYPCDELGDSLRVFSCGEEREEYRRLLREARARAGRLGVRFRHYPLRMEERDVCELDPARNIYIAHDCTLGPCVYLNQTRERIPRIFCGRRLEVPRVHFGNACEEGIGSLLEGTAYREFSSAFLRRREGYSRLLGVLSSEVSPGELSSIDARMRDFLRENPLPEPCTTCYKAYGI
ncbi:MAG: radical SAM protein [Euryarchaeota archaeon]|nr:radical SAM protein [Euryarchaeota archaeon]